MRIGSFEIKLPSLRSVEQSALQSVEKATQAVEDRFESGVSRAKQVLGPLLTGAGDAAFDGDLVGAGRQTFSPATPLSAVPAVLPQGGVTQPGVLIEVNGVGCNVAVQSQDMQALANASGSRVIGLHNATNGLPLDALQELGDEVGLGNDASAKALTQLVEQQLAQGQPVHLVAHSQGGAVTARALTQVRSDLIQQLGSASAAEKVLHDQVKVETFAGAAWNYPDGPQYRHYVNLADVVPQVFGQGLPEDLGFAHPGAGAQIFTFTDPSHFHSVETYLPHRLPW